MFLAATLYITQKKSVNYSNWLLKSSKINKPDLDQVAVRGLESLHTVIKVEVDGWSPLTTPDICHHPGQTTPQSTQSPGLVRSLKLET